MGIIDFRTVPDGTDFDADVCIVGTGPAGVAVALELLDASLRIVMVESGGLEPDETGGYRDEIESVGLRRAPQNETRSRGFGGTSALWTGRCGTFDATDYQERPWVAFSGWPIGMDDVARHIARAGEVLGLGPDLSVARAGEVLRRRDGLQPMASRQLRPVVFQFSQRKHADGSVARDFASVGVEGAEQLGALQHAGAPTPMHVGVEYRDVLERHDRVRILINATVTSIDTDPTGLATTGVTMASLDGRRGRVRAPRVVLAAGGIENARLLLASTAVDDRGVGNHHDQVGRFLADHPLTEVAAYHGPGSTLLRRRLGHFWYDRGDKRHVYTFGVRLDPDLQRREGLLNAALHLVEYGDRPPAVSSLGTALRSARAEGASHAMGDLQLAGAHPVELVTGIADRYLLRRPALPVPTRVSFACVVEQVPDPRSRVTLATRHDALGTPLARLDWRASDLEYETTRRMTAAVLDHVSELGLDTPVVAPWLDSGADTWRGHIHDAAHPMCTTRMAAHPSNGVVDAECGVHGVDGLFVAGGSVFSTSGYMNPTLVLTALAVRLGRQLRREAQPIRVTELADGVRSEPSPGRRLRVGLVGMGSRMTTVHLPVVRELGDDFELVGCCGRPGVVPAHASDRSGLPAFADAVSLVAATAPDLLIVAVANDAVDTALPALVELGVPLLIETPFCWSLRAGRRSLRMINERDLFVGVLEQFPFLPLERLKQRVIELGLLGNILSADNDGAIYDYHGIATLRAYLDGSAAERVTARSVQGGEATDPIVGVVQYPGAALAHQFERSTTGQLPSARGTITVRGSAGSIEDDCFTFIDDDGVTCRSIAVRDVDDAGRLRAISVATPIGEIRWQNPFDNHGFDDERIGIATMLTATAQSLRHGGLPPYSASQALVDVEHLAAMRFSTQRAGRPVSTHPNPIVERLRAKVEQSRGRLLGNR